jgi:cell division protein FtsB
MDQRVRNRAQSETAESFAGQFREFLRRNMNWILIVGLGLLLLQDIFGTHGVLAMRKTQQEAAAVQKEINRLDEENKQLQDRVKDLKSNPTTIERIAREEMGLARPGEVIFKIQPKPPDGPAASSQPAAQPAKH